MEKKKIEVQPVMRAFAHTNASTMILAIEIGHVTFHTGLEQRSPMYKVNTQND